MKLLVYVDPIDRIPAGYGLAYRCIDRMGAMVAPVPLNIAISLVRRAWWWMRAFGHNYEGFAEHLGNAYREGHARGWKAGVEHGKVVGAGDAFNRGRQEGLERGQKIALELDGPAVLRRLADLIERGGA